MSDKSSFLWGLALGGGPNPPCRFCGYIRGFCKCRFCNDCGNKIGPYALSRWKCEECYVKWDRMDRIIQARLKAEEEERRSQFREEIKAAEGDRIEAEIVQKSTPKLSLRSWIKIIFCSTGGMGLLIGFWGFFLPFLFSLM